MKMNPMEKWLIDFLKEWQAEKEKENLIPTVNLLIEELESKYEDGREGV